MFVVHSWANLLWQFESFHRLPLIRGANLLWQIFSNFWRISYYNKIMDSLFSDVDSLNESYSSEDQDDISSLFGGQARSIFSSLEETITKIDDFLLFERGFMHGDIVRMVSDPLGQMGKVFNTDMMVDLENIYGNKIKNTNSKNLRKVRLISIGDYVVRGAWIGKVEKIVDRLTVLFDDGTKSQLSAEGPEKIIAISHDVIEDPLYQFYPGQRVKVESASAKSTHWLCGMREDNYNLGTVSEVEAGLVCVDWLSCVIKNVEKGLPPTSLQDSKDLFLLSSFTHAHWQLGDWCLWRGTNDSNFQEIAVIAKTKTKVDVQWQDGSRSLGVDSHFLFPVNVIDVHDFWPDTFVSEKETVDGSQDGGSQRWGVVRSVDSKERTVKVKWLKSSVDFEEDEMEEIVSAYELVEHSDYSYCLGEPVFRADLKANEDQIENRNDMFLSYIGIVMGFTAGNVEVKWATGTTSKVAPYEIRRVDNCESTTSTSVLPNENVLQSHELPVKDNENQLLSPEVKVDPSSYSMSDIAAGFLKTISSTLFGSFSTSMAGEYKVALDDVDESPVEKVLDTCTLTPDEQMPAVDDSEISAKEISEQNEESTENITRSGSFKQFDVISDCSDHHFFDGNETGLQSMQVKPSWLKKVHREWSILQKDLPETIYVRVYEERMDLLRVAIVGIEGTPYHDNLFFFDIYLPEQYPNVPPMVFYNSGGLRINPNLYESGKVCLSLLNTWTGSGSEVWNPQSSTILQVLLSLQALVLNERPYFNEAGYGSQIGKSEGEQNSVTYNENAFLVSCRSMLYVLRKPPKHFEELVEEHFSECGRSILLACKAYMEGALVGNPLNCHNAEHENPNSSGFKIMLGKLIPLLVEAFSKKGVDCYNFTWPGSTIPSA